VDIKLVNGKVGFNGTDLLLTSDHLESVGQRLYIRLKSTYGKWFLNTEYGVDWFGKIFGKVKNKTRIDMLLKDEILKEGYVEKIESFKSSISPTTRAYSCTFKVKITNISTVQEFKIITTQNGFSLLTDNNKLILTP